MRLRVARLPEQTLITAAGLDCLRRFLMPSQVRFPLMLAVLLVDLGLSVGLLGLVCLLKPLAFIGLTARHHGLCLLAAGALLALLGWNLPASETRVTSARTQLDQLVPTYQFSEFHSILVNAPRDR